MLPWFRFLDEEFELSPIPGEWPAEIMPTDLKQNLTQSYASNKWQKPLYKSEVERSLCTLNKTKTEKHPENILHIAVTHEPGAAAACAGVR